MRAFMFRTFSEAIEQAKHQLVFKSNIVHPNHWQGMDISSKPEMATHEITHVSFGVDMAEMKVPSTAVGGTIGTLQEDIKPNLPWADDHFDERVCGAPINPGREWANWPYGASAARFLEGGKFNHNYMERYWPKNAGDIVGPTATKEEWEHEYAAVTDHFPSESTDQQWIHGIRYAYGDLNDLIKLIASDPFTRQAYLPIWFPEDTGGGTKRAPCTIGYHFLVRNGRLDVNYHIRSCDFVRHFRDDIYLTVRLLLYILDRLRATGDDRWNDVLPGKFLMQIGSLHVFRNDFPMLKHGTI